MNYVCVGLMSYSWLTMPEALVNNWVVLEMGYVRTFLGSLSNKIKIGSGMQPSLRSLGLPRFGTHIAGVFGLGGSMLGFPETA